MSKYEAKSVWGVVSGGILQYASSKHQEAYDFSNKFEFSSELKEGYAIFSTISGDLLDDTLYEEEHIAIGVIKDFEEEER